MKTLIAGPLPIVASMTRATSSLINPSSQRRLATARQSVRGGRATAREYLLRGLVTCGACSRRMQGATIRKNTYYRCTARTMAPGSSALADHPLTVNLREDHAVEAVNNWLSELFARENRDTTVAALLDGQSGVPTPDMDEAKARRADADARLRRYSGRWPRR